MENYLKAMQMADGPEGLKSMVLAKQQEESLAAAQQPTGAPKKILS